MLAIALIVFRETLEAALIISIVLAASVGVAGRGRWVSAGAGLGVLGACLVALFAAAISNAFAGSGQELLNAAVLLIAVGMLAWHNLWMASHARQMASEARALGKSVAAGTRPLIALAAIPATAVLREGAETVLFTFGIASGGDVTMSSLGAGILIGIAGGAALGATLYLGLLRIPMKRLFAVTGWLVLLLAAGLASQAMGFLVQADLVPSLGTGIWDTSFLLSEDGLVGRILHTLIGYVAQPQGIQVVAYVATLLLIGLPMWLISRPRRHAPMGRVEAGPAHL